MIVLAQQPVKLVETVFEVIPLPVDRRFLFFTFQSLLRCRPEGLSR